MKEELREIGLTDGEIDVYLTLLKIGPSTNSPIARHSGLQSSTVYYCLNSLIEKGFISYVKKGLKRYFIAAEPSNIMFLLDTKEKQLSEQREKIEKIMPELKAQQKELETATNIEVYEGFNGFKAVISEMTSVLKPGDDYSVFIVEPTFGDSAEVMSFFANKIRSDEKKGIKLRLLICNKYKYLIERLVNKKIKTKHVAIRTSKDCPIPCGLILYHNTTIMYISDEKPLIIKIKNNAFTEKYRSGFQRLWDRTEP